MTLFWFYFRQVWFLSWKTDLNYSIRQQRHISLVTTLSVNVNFIFYFRYNKNLNGDITLGDNYLKILYSILNLDNIFILNEFKLFVI